MEIIVPIKQVPETSNVKMDPETGTMIRAGVETVVNPLDLYAIETALVLREQYGGSVRAITMGPPPAEKALREAVAMGCDDGVLVSDRKFGGSDTWATSYTLAQAIRSLAPYDLIITGERATDGDTAQVGPGIAAWLDIPLATYVARVRVQSDDDWSGGSGGWGGSDRSDRSGESGGSDRSGGSGESGGSDRSAGSDEHHVIRVERLVEEGYQRLALPLPALITVVKEIASPRLPTLRGKKRARAMEMVTRSADSLDLESDYLGLKGSPTKVVKIATPKVTRTGTVVSAADEDSVERAVDQLIDFLESRELV